MRRVIRRKHMGIALALAVAHAGCRSFADRLMSNTEPTTCPSIKTTTLAHLFAPHPYDTSRPSTDQYPRVALTVVQCPHGHAGVMLDGISGQVPGEWVLTAKVWTSPTLSHDVGPFSVDFQNDATRGTTPPNYNVSMRNWLLSGDVSSTFSGDSTGNQRTQGPKPPEEGFPNDMATQRFTTVQMGHLDIRSNDAAMLSLAYAIMDFDPNVHEDRRAWVVKFSQAVQH